MANGDVSYTYIPAQPPGTNPGMLLRSDGAYIPLDPGNNDYQAFLAWLAAGNAPPQGWVAPQNQPRRGLP